MKNLYDDDIITIEHVVQNRQDLIDFTVYVADAIDPEWLDDEVIYICGGGNSGKTILAQAFFQAFDGVNRFLGDQSPRDIPVDNKFYLEDGPDGASGKGVSLDTIVNGTGFTLIYQCATRPSLSDDVRARQTHLYTKDWKRNVSVLTGFIPVSDQPVLLELNIGSREFDPSEPRRLTLTFKKSDLGSCPRFMSYIDALEGNSHYQQPDPTVWRGGDAPEVL